jgi:hypothetical protein
MVETISTRAGVLLSLRMSWAPSGAAGEDDCVADVEPSAASGRSEGGFPGDHGQQLFIGPMPVVGPGRLSGREFAEACSDQFCTEGGA